jgi:hypothetical protein
MANRTSLERKRAFADALSGVAGSLVSLWTFYPIEKIKLQIQAGSSSSSAKLSSSRSLFQGCRAKTLHTASSNFCYFFFYSWIVAKYTKRNNGGKQINPGTRLFLSAFAAMMNTFITLPLDVLSSKQVTENIEVDDDKQEIRMDHVWGQLSLQEKDNESYSEFQEARSELEEEKNGDALSADPKNENLSNEIRSSSLENIRTLARYPSYGSLDIAGVFQTYCEDTSKLDRLKSLWKGLIPALLLCTNPSIHYTAFDVTKTRMLRNRSSNSLSMSEAFLVGLFAKFVATIATYPLIRAKVILMVTSEKSLFATLGRSYKEGGIRSLYKGCDWQLLHTVLKSALMMMVRERMSDSSRRLIVGDTNKKR